MKNLFFSTAKAVSFCPPVCGISCERNFIGNLFSIKGDI